MSNLHYERVFKSPINTSVSKNLYSFPKTQRFQRTKQSPCTKSFYDIKSTFHTARTTGLGYGSRSNLINEEAVPESGKYNYNLSPFHNNKIKKRGYSFGGQIKAGFPYQDIDKDNPGPGKYEAIFKNQKGYSIRNKYDDPLQKDKNSLGPGQYRVAENLSKTGIYFNSKFKNSFCGKIGRQKRFGDDRTESPGPGTYKNKFDINRSGIYFDSRIKSNYVSSFEGTMRPSIIQKVEAPGPGAYFVFSDFGSKMAAK